MASAATPGLAIGLIVPCHNEAAVIARRLRNLARCEWPSGARHRVLVVDDESRDDTRSLATALAMELTASCAGRVAFDVIESRGPGGKCSAIRTGLAELAATPLDLVGITDADVVCGGDALVRLADAFAHNSQLGLACGEQRFIKELAPDGSWHALAGGEQVSAAGRYDRLTALVRRFESRRGRLFSVHGQLLLWRVEAALLPTPGVAADDIDLMLAARRAGWRVELVQGATFLELKPAVPQDRSDQALRRARAYFDALRTDARLGRDWFDRVQWWSYRWLPRAAPLAFALTLLAVVTASTWWLVSAYGALVAMAPVVILCATLLTPPGRDLVRLLSVIRRAARASAAAPGGDRWEMARR